MKGKYAVGSLIGLGLAGSVGGISYYSFNHSSEENLEQKVKDLAKKISNHIKNYPNKENWKNLWSKFLVLQEIKKDLAEYSDDNSEIIAAKKAHEDQTKNLKRKIIEVKKEHEDEIKKLKKKIEEKENYKLEEIYKEMEKAAILQFKISEILKKLTSKRNELVKKISENSKNFEKFQKFKDLNFDIKNIKKEMEELINEEPENLKEKIKIWLDLYLESENLIHLSNILENIYNS